MKKSTKRILVISILLNLILVTFIIVSAASNDSWVAKLKIYGRGNKVVKRMTYKTDNFRKDYKKFVELQMFFLPDEKKGEMKKQLETNKAKREYVKSVIQNYLLTNYAKNRNIINEDEVKSIVRTYSKFIKRQLVLQIFINKFLKKKVKQPTTSQVKKHLELLAKDSDFQKAAKNWDLGKKMKYAKKHKFELKVRKKLNRIIEALINRNVVEYNDKVKDIKVSEK